MADSKSTRTVQGFTRLEGDPGSLTGLSGLIFRGSDGFDRGIWVDTNGKLRIADVDAIESSSFNPDSAGVVVGTQS